MKLQQWNLEAYIAEFIGTFFLVFTVSLNAVQRTAHAAISIGCIYMVMVSASVAVSGAHFNPAVTLGVLLGRGSQQVSLKDVLVYIVVQLLGGLAAGVLCWYVVGATYSLHPGQGYNKFDVFIVEALFTAALVIVVLSLGASRGRDTNYTCFPLAVGFTVMAAAFAVGGVSGYSLNPAVAFGVNVTDWMSAGGRGSSLSCLLLYLLSPLAGALLSACLGRVLWVAQYTSEAPEAARLLPRA
mmetsp:Transcript_88337/g.274584  ORF Transcript_88337/g.274584 Transcript_88337/m.274584 type:complete len:241 (-) Transcript_88337:151-873(-)|eukprot:CAMPEP_0204600588 /NCGR_PEP_ID=MMETSP0661-20131031/55532_1 /ASSEMBLY_ACC=CAM_ASM_000606 /TAXON_ID=109239 /ORGANISM="Alexandrium margalefi, Strain AMGDE01CS-322" /LENGTH=240 /DNA_ID=CAMNT_0051611403 /DNA_START=44 /DNA_END=766 /DNA_ORIENTATION=+